MGASINTVIRVPRPQLVFPGLSAQQLEKVSGAGGVGLEGQGALEGKLKRFQDGRYLVISNNDSTVKFKLERGVKVCRAKYRSTGAYNGVVIVSGFIKKTSRLEGEISKAK